jgi:hypothetical protein
VDAEIGYHGLGLAVGGLEHDVNVASELLDAP